MADEKAGALVVRWLQRLFYVMVGSQGLVLLVMVAAAWQVGVPKRMNWALEQLYLVTILISSALALLFAELLSWFHRRNAKRRKTKRSALNAGAISITIRISMINVVCVFLLGCLYYLNIRWLFAPYALFALYFLSAFPKKGKLRRAMGLSHEEARELGL